MNIRRTKYIFSLMLVAVLASGGCNRNAYKDLDDEEKTTPASKKPVELSWVEGQVVLKIEIAAQKRMGLATVTLASKAKRSEVSAPAVVLSVQDLVSSRNRYIATQLQLETIRADADVARREYSRQRTLFQQNQNTSEKALQSAEALSKARAAEVTATEQQLALEEAAVRQDWGRVVAKWIVEGSTELQQVLSQRQMLVQITLPSGENVELPRNISLELPDRTRTEARLVSPVPKLDPRIQGKSFLYLSTSRSGLAPGTNLLAHLTVGARKTGVLVPASSVVWSEGKTWVYQQTAPDQFVQRAIATDMPLENGFFVIAGLRSGDKIVTQGAQALLSAEALAQSGGTVADED